MGKYARIVRGDIPSQFSSDLLQQQYSEVSESIRYQILISALKLDYNAVIEPIIQGTDMNGYLITNDIIEKINLKDFIAHTDELISQNSKILTKILYSELVRLQIQQIKISGQSSDLGNEYLIKLEGICFKILKIMK